MRRFDEIWSIAAERRGGEVSLEKALSKPKSEAELAAMPDDHWLSLMTKCIFQAGFNWKVVDKMWPGFEAAFDGFDVRRCAALHDEDVDRLVSDRRIVRHGPKIWAVQQNALFLNELAAEQGTAAKVFATWPSEDYVGLLAMLKERGARLGGSTGQYMLRFAGKDSFILSRDVVARLIEEGVIDKLTASKKTMRAVQDAFNSWSAQSNRSLTEISRVLAMSIG